MSSCSSSHTCIGQYGSLRAPLKASVSDDHGQALWKLDAWKIDVAEVKTLSDVPLLPWLSDMPDSLNLTSVRQTKDEWIKNSGVATSWTCVVCWCCNVDRNECDANLCGPDSISCTNLDGTYKCTCKDGYEAKNGTCLGAVCYCYTFNKDVQSL